MPAVRPPGLVGAIILAAGLLTVGGAVLRPAVRQASEDGTPLERPEDTFEALVDRLGDDKYATRQSATQELIAMGESIAAALGARLEKEPDPEIQHRLRYVLANISAPRRAVLVASAEPDCGLLAGDVITHVNGRIVRNGAELRARLSNDSLLASLRVRRATGTYDVGPIRLVQILSYHDYAAPRGETLARILRLYASGWVEQAYELLQRLDADQPVRPDELSAELRASIAFTAGDAQLAFALLRRNHEIVRASDDNFPWVSPSGLDRLVGGKAPFHLEWVLFTENGPEFQENRNDPDLRMQRILVPAHRYADTLVRAAELWWTRFREQFIKNPDAADTHVAGNMLAVIGWMLYDLGLRSECCRLIEPRSMILRRRGGGPKKWVRVDTDAWLVYLAGDVQAAVDEFYEHALAVLENPPGPRDPRAVIRNPHVAARIAFFLYQLHDDRRIGEMLSVVAHESHPILKAYAYWMMAALRPETQKAIHRDLQEVLPHLSTADVLPTARGVALLEYVQAHPQIEVLRAARQRVFESAAGRERDVFLAIIDAIEQLSRDEVEAAAALLEPVTDAPEAAALAQTIEFRLRPPAAARNHEALRAPLLSVPIGTDAKYWLVLSRDRRLLLFDVDASLLTAVDLPVAGWFPSPLTWPWIGREEKTGRVWVYALRRVLEIRPDGSEGLRLNIETDQIAGFHRLIADHFGALADAVAAAGPLAPGEHGAFLRGEIRKRGEAVSDPDLRELALLRALPRDPRVVHVALRGGPHLLIDAVRGTSWSARWIQQKLDLARPPIFFAQAVAQQEAEPADPLVWLFSDQGLIRFDTASQTLQRVDLPGEQPYAAVIPESAPYDRKDPKYLYCARLPEHGGQVYRVTLADLSVEALDLVNEALPIEYYRLMSRADLRAKLDARLEQVGASGLQAMIADVEEAVGRLEKTE